MPGLEEQPPHPSRLTIVRKGEYKYIFIKYKTANLCTLEHTCFCQSLAYVGTPWRGEKTTHPDDNPATRCAWAELSRTANTLQLPSYLQQLPPEVAMRLRGRAIPAQPSVVPPKAETLGYHQTLLPNFPQQNLGPQNLPRRFCQRNG